MNRNQRSFVLTAVEVAAAAASSKDASGLGEGVTVSDYLLEIESRTIADVTEEEEEEEKAVLVKWSPPFLQQQRVHLRKSPPFSHPRNSL
jgi:hypothetical protein